MNLKSKILTSNEEIDLKSQIVTSSYTNLRHGGKRKPSNVFTEQGIYALSGILKGPLATAVSINLIRAFKQLKDLYNNNSFLLDKVIDNEIKLIEHDKKLEIVFDYISDHKEVKEKIFYKGQIYDAKSLLIELIIKANKEIILIDNYIDIKTTDILKYKKTNVKTSIYTLSNKLTNSDIDSFNDEYPTLNVYKTNKFHDRFLILDNKTIYLIGASIKDAGNKCFGIVEIDSSNINRIKDELNR